jgi:hypothetical protein
MRKSHALLLAGLVLLGASGCIDTWAGYGREERNLKNELADYLTKVVDEETAKYLVEGPGKKLKEKWETHKERMTNFIKGQDLGSIEQKFRELEGMQSGKVEMGINKSKRVFNKSADGVITLVEGTAEGSMKETIDTLTDPDYQKAMKAAQTRLEEQSRRIGALGSSPNLQRCRDLYKEIFPR